MSRIGDFIQGEYRAMVGYVRNRIADEAERDAEDIVQDVIVNIFDRANPAYPIENLAAYIYRALRNKIVDVLRKRKKNVELFDILSDSEVRVEDAVEKEELLDLMFRHMDDLDEEEKAIILASEFQGWSFKELSRKWGIPQGTLMSRKKRALDKVRKRMKNSHPQKQ